MKPFLSAPNRRLESEKTDLEKVITQSRQIVIKQQVEPLELVSHFETANRYLVFDGKTFLAGYIQEETRSAGTLFTRQLGSHRSLSMGVSDHRGNRILTFDRPFYFLLSNLTVSSPQRRHMGLVQQRFGILRQTYDLYDSMGVPFAQIQSHLLNFWHFSIYDNELNEVGSITKQWGGFLKEYFTDSDSFLIDFGPKRWNPVQRAIIFAAALSIDLDFFENNSPFSMRNLLTKLLLKLKPPTFTFRD